MMSLFSGLLFHPEVPTLAETLPRHIRVESTRCGESPLCVMRAPMGNHRFRPSSRWECSMFMWSPIDRNFDFDFGGAKISREV